MPVDLKIIADLLTVNNLVENQVKWHRSLSTISYRILITIVKKRCDCIDPPPEQTV